MQIFTPRFLLAEGENKAGEKFAFSVHCRQVGNCMVIIPAASYSRVRKFFQSHGIVAPFFSAAVGRHDAYKAMSSPAPIPVQISGSHIMPDHSLYVSFVRCDFGETV